ncbi:TolC family protein [Sulfurimonas sp. HSL3-7]|uniref:TolC family protein n=1 Tax=Sulfonitrofixus jiaomeiensis TaxID=3131938 RepID=UPI0031F792F6
MKQILLMFLPLLLSATPLEVIIDNALAFHPSLEAIQARLYAEDYQISSTRNFANPEIAFAINDIQFEDITDRSLEPMQTTSVILKQKFPSFGKRDAATARSRARKQVTALSLEESKVKLVERIKMTSYGIWEVDEELKVIGEYIEVTRQNIELNTAYSATRTSSHMGIMSAELTLSQLKIKKSRYESMRKMLYAKLSYLAAQEILSVEVDLQVQAPKELELYTQKLANNRGYGAKSAEVQLAQSDIKVQDLSGNVDPFVQVGYFHRQSYNDYVNVGFGMALPIYGTESDNTEAARKMALSKASESQDYLQRLRGELGGLYAQLEDAYAIYRIIHDESMPQIEHMFELTSASVKSGQDLFVYIDLLKQKLALDEQLIKATVRFNMTEASLDAMTGETR